MTLAHVAVYAALQEPAGLERGRAHVRSGGRFLADRAEVSPRAQALQDQQALQRLDLIRKRIEGGFYRRSDVLAATLDGVTRDIDPGE